ncbi:MAG TPA: alpha-amylase family glycosyl hydrolase [Candidatus Saccharimonadales bacterium]|nr:alpha-amylase family glycosyl hydrolase [Candidatus Saccharimonadales bacterium]
MDINWPQNSIIYHIYPRSFKDTNGDGIGDLQGIIDKIDYLTYLGVNAVWLSPIYKSPQKDFGYDVSDYKRVDKCYGTIKKFEELAEKLHKKNIRIMMDYVPNHTSSKHPWFEKSRSSRDNTKRNWYVWRNPKKDGSPPNNWLSVFGGSAWQWDKKTKQYYLHTFDLNQPDLNWHNNDVEKHMLSVINYWLKRGADGFRVDAIYHLFKNQDFGDEPENPNYSTDSLPYYKLFHTKTYALPKTIELMRRISHLLKRSGGKFMVSEVHTGPEDLMKMYKNVDWRYFQPFNFSLIFLPWIAKTQKEYVDQYDRQIGKTYFPCYVSGNHDVKRAATRIGEKQSRNLAIMLLTLRGFSYIYSGDELAMTDTPIAKDKVMDTFELHSPGLGLGRDPQRTPMQWDTTKNAGFSTDSPWLPVNKNYKKLNVQAQMQDKKSHLNLYKKLINLKKTSPAIKEGEYIPLPMPAPNVYSYLREKGAQKVLVVVNFDNKPKKLSLGYKEARIILDSFLTREPNKKVSLVDFKLKPDEGIIFEL